MNRKEIADKIRTEAGEIEALIKKLQFRCEQLRWLADVLDSSGRQSDEKGERPFPKGKFWKFIDKLYADKA